MTTIEDRVREVLADQLEACEYPVLETEECSIIADYLTPLVTRLVAALRSARFIVDHESAYSVLEEIDAALAPFPDDDPYREPLRVL